MVSLVEIGSEVYQQGAWCIPYHIYHWFDKNIKTELRAFKVWVCFALPCSYRCLNFLSHACVRQRCICVQMQVGMRHSHLLKHSLPVSCFLVGTCLDFLALPVRGFNPTYFLPTFYLSSLRRRVKPTKSIREVFATVAHNKM